MFGPPVHLGDLHALDAFDCGKEPLNIFLKQFARQNEKRHGSRTFVIAGRDNRVVGYYTLAAGSVEHAEMPRKVRKGLGKYPIPVVILARLTTDRTVRGQKLGAKLLKDAVLRVAQTSESIGVRALIVHAKDEEAKRFYEHFDFEESPTDPMHLFLPMEEILRNEPIAKRDTGPVSLIEHYVAEDLGLKEKI